METDVELVIGDLRADERFAAMPVVTGAVGLRSYAGFPLRDHDGAVLGALCVSSTAPSVPTEVQRRVLAVLADQVVAQLELRRRIEQLRGQSAFTEAVLDSLDVGVVACDADGGLTTVNRAARTFHGRGPAAGAHPGRHAQHYDLYDEDGTTTLSPERVPLATALRAGEVNGRRIVIAPVGLPRRTVVCTGRRLLGGAGEVLGAVVVMADVTAAEAAGRELVATRDVLAERQIFLDTLLDDIDVGILCCDAAGRLTEDNAFTRGLTGMRQGELVGVHIDGTHTRKAGRAADGLTPVTAMGSPLVAALQDGTVRDRELLVRRPGVEDRRLVVHGSRLQAPDGRVLGAMIALHDVTAERERAAELAARISEVEALSEASRTILSGSGDPRDATVRAAHSLARASLSLLLEPSDPQTPEGVTLRTTATSDPAVDGLVLGPLEPSLARQAFETGRAVVVVDTLADPRAHAGHTARVLAAVGGSGAALIVPVSRGGTVHGVLSITLRGPLSRLPARVLGLLEILASELATALERDQLRAELAAQATTDPLTGLLNRRGWASAVGRVLAPREPGDEVGPACMAVIDLDHFKRYNDAKGHPAGDQLLVRATRLWSSAVRADDVLARLGGEEFGLLLPGCTAEAAASLLQRLRFGVPDGQTVSIGIAQRRPGETAESWLAAADAALYEAKLAGRDIVRVAAGGGLPTPPDRPPRQGTGPRQPRRRAADHTVPRQREPPPPATERRASTTRPPDRRPEGDCDGGIVPARDCSVGPGVEESRPGAAQTRVQVEVEHVGLRDPAHLLGLPGQLLRLPPLPGGQVGEHVAVAPPAGIHRPHGADLQGWWGAELLRDLAQRPLDRGLVRVERTPRERPGAPLVRPEASLGEQVGRPPLRAAAAVAQEQPGGAVASPVMHAVRTDDEAVPAASAVGGCRCAHEPPR